VTLQCRDTGCRATLEKDQTAQENSTMKNLFATIGFCVVLKKGYELYCEYSELKRHRKQHEPSAS
jgi:hypothetical protein